MFCAQCGNPIGPDQRYCSVCGHAASGAAASGTAAGMPGIELPPGALQTTVVPATSGKAIASLVLGLFSWLFPAAILAIIFGHISRGEIRRSNGRLKGAGMALAGLIMGYCAIAIIPVVLIIAAIAIPNLLRSRIAANEASAVGSVRTLNTAEITYNTKYPTVGFACTLGAMGPPTGATADSTHADLIDSNLAAGTKSGYSFVVACVGSGVPAVNYQVTAAPVSPGVTGQRYFCSDTSGVIRYDGTSTTDCLTNGNPL